MIAGLSVTFMAVDVDVLPDHTQPASASPIASLKMGATGQSGSPAVTVGGGEEVHKVSVNIVESHVLTLSVTMGHDNENGGSGGARTRNLCRDRAAL